MPLSGVDIVTHAREKFGLVRFAIRISSKAACRRGALVAHRGAWHLRYPSRIIAVTIGISALISDQTWWSASSARLSVLQRISAVILLHAVLHR